VATSHVYVLLRRKDLTKAAMPSMWAGSKDSSSYR